MCIAEEIEDDGEPREIVRLPLPLDRRTLSWLASLSPRGDEQAGAVVASMLKMIREDDEAAHSTRH